jgi:hypothetical protein
MNSSQQMLSVSDHNRSFISMTYVYPVVSRRAGGVSVGINLNPNNACNWHCAYCQVPDLVRGAAPEIDLGCWKELQAFLDELLHGNFMAEHVPPEAQVIRDIAFSGNGEPTSSKAFAEIVERVVAIRDQAGLSAVPIRLITNGSLVDRPYVQTRCGAFTRRRRGVVQAGRGPGGGHRPHQRRRHQAAGPRPPAGAVCLPVPDLGADLHGPLGRRAASEAMMDAYLAGLEQAGTTALRGVHLYGLARPSLQPEAVHLQRLSPDALERIARA